MRKKLIMLMFAFVAVLSFSGCRSVFQSNCGCPKFGNASPQNHSTVHASAAEILQHN